MDKYGVYSAANLATSVLLILVKSMLTWGKYRSHYRGQPQQLGAMFSSTRTYTAGSAGYCLVACAEVKSKTIKKQK